MFAWQYCQFTRQGDQGFADIGTDTVAGFPNLKQQFFQLGIELLPMAAFVCFYALGVTTVDLLRDCPLDCLTASLERFAKLLRFALHDIAI